MADSDGQSSGKSSGKSSGTGEEVDLLKGMIVERDRRIEQLTLDISNYERKLIQTGDELVQTKTSAASARIEQTQIEQDFQRRTHQARQRIKVAEKNVIQQNGGLHVYANVLKEAAPESADSSYVIRMQSQLCKAMHCMGILDHQLESLNNYNATTSSSLKAAVTQVVEDKSMVEVKVMNELMRVDDEKRKMEDGIRSSRSELVESQRTFNYQTSDDEGSDTSEEIDEDLLQEIIGERQEDIDMMEQENTKQATQIEELTAKIKAMSTSGDDQ